MRSPNTPPGPPAVTPVEGGRQPSARQDAAQQRLPGSPSFAELLAEAEAVQDRVEIGSRAVPRGWPGALQGAATRLARQTPWLGLPLLLRRPRRDA
jgi:hypothetical protein